MLRDAGGFTEICGESLGKSDTARFIHTIIEEAFCAVQTMKQSAVRDFGPTPRNRLQFRFGIGKRHFAHGFYDLAGSDALRLIDGYFARKPALDEIFQCAGRPSFSVSRMRSGSRYDKGNRSPEMSEPKALYNALMRGMFVVLRDDERAQRLKQLLAPKYGCRRRFGCFFQRGVQSRKHFMKDFCDIDLNRNNQTSNARFCSVQSKTRSLFFILMNHIGQPQNPHRAMPECYRT